jgi:predicted AAA+ superfamily ATPase
MNFQHLFNEQNQLLNQTSLEKKRYLYSEINWNLKSLAILGQRGLGKTTMMLQYIKEHYDKSDKALYISLDNPYFQAISLLEFADEFCSYGGEVLFIDEVHKYSDWARHIKSIYDLLSLRVVVSGSSILQINRQNVDLSRRMILYHLENLSFREYLFLKEEASFESYSLEDILQNHYTIASEITQSIKPLKLFKEYLEFGCYPFILEDRGSYHQRIIQVINLILESDLPHINKIEMQQIRKLKKLLYLLAVSVPFIPNITDLAKATDISRPKLYEYLNYLEEAKIINSIRSPQKGYNIMSKPEKLFMQNTNISSALTQKVNIGSAREAFFVNQIKNYFSLQNRFINEDIFVAKKGDFLVDGTYTFEVGGKNKSFKQIKDMKNSFVASDDIEIGFGAKIPLWLFGFLY